MSGDNPGLALDRDDACIREEDCEILGHLRRDVIRYHFPGAWRCLQKLLPRWPHVAHSHIIRVAILAGAKYFLGPIVVPACQPVKR